jgi:hypothetical protein
VTEVTVEAGGEGGEVIADESARMAAVAEGASSVNAGIAAQAAGEAQEAAEAALSAAQANIESGAVVGEAAGQAREAAAEAASYAEMTLQALNAQTAAITALTEELRASRQPAAPPEKRKPKRDREPRGSGGGTQLVRR